MKNSVYLWRSVMCSSFSIQFPDNIRCLVPQGSELRHSHPWSGLWVFFLIVLLLRCPEAGSKHQPIPSYVIFFFSWLFASEILAELLSFCLKLSPSLNLLEKNFAAYIYPYYHPRGGLWENTSVHLACLGKRKASRFQYSLSLDGEQIFSGLK